MPHLDIAASKWGSATRAMLAVKTRLRSPLPHAQASTKEHCAQFHGHGHTRVPLQGAHWCGLFGDDRC
jgi:hypothetical protein